MKTEDSGFTERGKKTLQVATLKPDVVGFRSFKLQTWGMWWSHIPQ